MKAIDDFTTADGELSEFRHEVSIDVQLGATERQRRYFSISKGETSKGVELFDCLEGLVPVRCAPFNTRAALESFRTTLDQLQRTIDALVGTNKQLVETERAFQAVVQGELFDRGRVAGVRTYFIWDGEFVKIGGSSVSELKRKKQFQTAQARELTVLAVIPGANERYVRALFMAHHVRGEWFQMCPEIEAFIQAWQKIERVMW